MPPRRRISEVVTLSICDGKTARLFFYDNTFAIVCDNVGHVNILLKTLLRGRKQRIVQDADFLKSRSAKQKYLDKGRAPVNVSQLILTR